MQSGLQRLKNRWYTVRHDCQKMRRKNPQFLSTANSRANAEKTLISRAIWFQSRPYLRNLPIWQVVRPPARKPAGLPSRCMTKAVAPEGEPRLRREEQLNKTEYSDTILRTHHSSGRALVPKNKTKSLEFGNTGSSKSLTVTYKYMPPPEGDNGLELAYNLIFEEALKAWKSSKFT